jgi:hypothetical protein
MTVNCDQSITPDIRAKSVLAAAPKLAKISGEAAISWGLLDGANRAILESSESAIVMREIANGYINNCALMLVIRLALLLDGAHNVVSFQSVYRNIESPKVTNALIRRVCAEDRSSFAFQRKIEQNIRSSVERFLDTYRTIDWDLHSRLKHFRNLGVAHLTLHDVEKYVKYGELHALTLLVRVLAECLEPFLLDGDIPVREDQIQEYSDQAREIFVAFPSKNVADQ